MPAGSGIAQATLAELLGAVAKVGVSKAMQAQLIRMEKTPDGPFVHRKADMMEDVVKQQLVAVRDGRAEGVGAEAVGALQKRKLLTVSTITSFKLVPGGAFADWGSGKTVRARCTRASRARGLAGRAADARAPCAAPPRGCRPRRRPRT